MPRVLIMMRPVPLVASVIVGPEVNDTAEATIDAADATVLSCDTCTPVPLIDAMNISPPLPRANATRSPAE